MNVYRIFFGFVLLMFLSGNSMGSEIFLVSSYLDSGGILSEPTILYRFAEKQIVETNVLFKEGEIVKYLQMFPEKGLLIAGADQTSVEHGVQIKYKVAKMEDPFSIDEMEITNPSSVYCRDSYLLNKNGSLVLSASVFSQDETGRLTDSKLIGVNMSNKGQEMLDWTSLNDMEFNGNGGILQSVYSDVKLFLTSEGRLLFPSKSKNKTDLAMIIPSKFFDKGSKQIQLLGQNEYMNLYLLNLSEQKSDRKKEEKEIVVLNKRESIWKKIYLPIHLNSLRVFGKMIASNVIEFGGYKMTPGSEKIKYPNKKSNVDALAKRADCYIPGVLFVYDAYEDKEYRYDTNQGDSEVLLIDSTKVYWRKYDEIYSSDLSNGTFVNEALLLKSDVIPDVHWMYCN